MEPLGATTGPLSRRDLAALAVLGLFAAAVAGVYFHFLDIRGSYPNELFVPAALSAAGQGFHHADIAAAPAVREFISGNAWSLAPGDVPPLEPLPLDSDQRYQVYHVLLMAACFKLFGISWSVIHGVTAAYYCISGALVYLMCRLAVRRPFAVLGAVLFLCQPMLIVEMYFPRDFGKTPFILALIYLYLRLLARRTAPRALLGVSALMALVLGIGLGFRRDLVIFLAPTVFVLLACPLARGVRRRLRYRTLAFALGGAVFLCASAPVFTGFARHGTLVWHDTLMGFAANADMMLGTNNASYTRISWRQDVLVSNTAAAALERRERSDPGGAAVSGNGAKARLLGLYALYFPADIITRAYANALAIFRFLIIPMPAWAAAVLALLPAAALLRTARGGLRLGWSLFILGLFLCTYTSIQFAPRHAIPLLALPCACIALLAARAGAVWNAWRAGDGIRHVFQGWMRPLLGFALPAMLLLAVPLAAARHVQADTLGQFVETLQALPAVPLSFSSRELGGMTLHELDEPLPEVACSYPDRPYEAVESYLVATCVVEEDPPVLWLVYDTDAPGFVELTAPVLVDPSGRGRGRTVRFHFPVFSITAPAGWSRFRGVALPLGGGSGLEGIARLDGADALPILPSLAIAMDGPPPKLFQHLGLRGAFEDPYQPEPSVNPLEIQARARLAEGDVAGAESHFRKAIATDPNSLQPAWSLANLLVARGRTREAADLLAQAVLARPGDCLRARLLRDALVGADPAVLQSTLARLGPLLDGNSCARECLVLFPAAAP